MAISLNPSGSDYIPMTNFDGCSFEDINDEVIAYVIQEQLRININPFKLTRIGKAKN